ncbi:hypothetical protein A2U01_0062471, partial [Trifolium medium]|nr:hypothetical protein [Trifolium medium]
GSQALVPCHSPFPQGGRKESAPNGAADHAKIEDGINIVNMLIQVSLGTLLDLSFGEYLNVFTIL